MMHIYYGDGKGKTTAALGLALRWVGRGGKVVIAQFLKGADSGERVAWKELPNVTLLPVPEKLPFLWDMTVEERKNAAEEAKNMLQRSCEQTTAKTLLVLDATTGQNGLIQARTFKETAGLTGIILTKLDGTAKGGIVIAIAQELGVPVKFVGVGEGIDDLKPFDPTAFVQDMI